MILSINGSINKIGGRMGQHSHKLMFFTIMLILCMPLFAQSYIEIGNGTTTSNQPIYSSWNYGWSKTIYTQAQLGAAKTITHIALHQANQSTFVFNNQKIYFKHSNAINLNNNTGYEDPTNGWTQVYNASFVSQNGWVQLDITDFQYDGTNSLMILWENRHGTSTYSGPNFYATDAPAGTTLTACLGSDTSFPTGSGWAAYPQALPNMRFYYASTAPGTPDNPIPQNNAQNIAPEQMLSWTFGSNTSAYDLKLGTSPENMQLLVTNQATTNPTASFSPQNLNFNTTYYWQVIAKDENGQSTPGPVWNFKTELMISDLPYNQNFDGFPSDLTGYALQQWLPDGWSKTDDNWSLRNEFGIDETACMAVSFSHSNPSILYSPRFTVTNGYRLRFQWRDADAFRSAGHDSTMVEITTNGGQDWSLLGILTSNQSTDWMTVTYSLNSFTGNNVKIRFRDMTDGSISADGTRIDNFMIELIPTAGEIELSPQQISFSNVGVNANATSSLIIKNLTGTLVVTGIDVVPPFSASYSGTITEGDSVIVPVSFNPQSSGNFTAMLTVNVNGNFLGNNTVMLYGNAIQATPSFLQTFDASTVPNLPENWSKIRMATNTYTDIVTSANTSDAHSPNNFIKMLNFPEDSNATLMLVSPPVSNFNDNQLKIWAKTQWPNARFEVGTLTNPNDASTFVPVRVIYPAQDYSEFTVTFTGINDVRHIALKKVCADSLSSVYIDDISWQNGDTSNPPSPAELVSPLNMATNVITTPQLRWTTAAGSPTGYKIYLGTNNPPSNILNGTDLQNVLSYNIANALSFATTYYWKVVPYNPSGDAVNCPVWSFTTLSDPAIEDFPWNENFDAYAGMIQPLGWTVLNLNNDTATWKTISNPNNPDIAYSQPTALHCPFSFSSAQDDWIFTPPISMVQGRQYQLSFKYHVMQAPEGSVLPEKLEVKWGNATNPESMFDQSLFSNTNIINENYLTATSTIQATETGIYYIGFHCFSDAMMWLMIIDDINLTESLSTDDHLTHPVKLNQNYPNPFNPETKISFELKTTDHVELKIYNSKGQLVQILKNNTLNQGIHEVVWNGKDINNHSCPSGVYFYQLKTNNQVLSKKMILMK